MKFLLKSKIDVRSMINPVHEAQHFKKFYKNKKKFKNSIEISRNSIHLPSSTHLTSTQIKYICDKIVFFFDKKFK